jgi:hypothetical protein
MQVQATSCLMRASELREVAETSDLLKQTSELAMFGATTRGSGAKTNQDIGHQKSEVFETARRAGKVCW